VLLDFGPEGLAWNRLTARLYGGSVTSSGRLARKTGRLDATLAWRDLRIEDVPTRASGERALAAILAGACSGEVRFERASRAANALGATGHVSLAEPRFLFVQSLAEPLSRYRLPAIDARGTKPATMTLRLERGELVAEPIALSLEGLDVDGVLRLREGRRVLGRLVVRLRDAYLAQSPLLAIPAALAGEVAIPLYILGTPGAIDVQTDALEILDGLLKAPRPRR
jgi:hypothetical protein